MLQERGPEPLPELLIDLGPGHERTQDVRDMGQAAEGEARDQERLQVRAITALVGHHHVESGPIGQRFK